MSLFLFNIIPSHHLRLQQRGTLLSLLAATALLLGGCGSARTSMVTPDPAPQPVASLAIQKDPSTIGLQVDTALLHTFEETLRAELINRKGFRQGADLTLRYRAVSGNPGSRSGRFWLGLSVGEGDVVMRIDLAKADGTVVMTMDVTGTVTGGWLGGSYAIAFEQAAEETARVVKQTYALHP